MDVATKPKRGIALTVSFVVIGGLLLLVITARVFAYRSGADVPVVRNEVERRVQRAVDSGDLSVDIYRVASNLGFVNPDSVSPVVGLLPQVSGVELYTSGLSANGTAINFM